MINIPYEYKNCPIPGGGYVTGFLFSTVDKKARYIRTDIGGTYKFDEDTQRFIPLNDDVNMMDLAPTYVAGIATYDKVPGSLYVVCGLDRGATTGELLISKDYGKTFTKRLVPANAHGNKNGRGTGKRVIIDQRTGDLYYASYDGGLYVTKDEGETWTELDVCGEKHFTFVFMRPDTDTLVVGTAGLTNKKSDLERGHSLFISYDKGAHFEKITQPDTGIIEKSRMSGLVGHRYFYDGKYLYITANHTGEYAYVVELGYSCDCGQVMGGMVLRFSFDKEGKITGGENIAPDKNFKDLRYGFGGISASLNTKGLLVLSTITRNEGDIIYRSYDYGETWEKVLEGLSIGKMEFRTPYMRPCCNGNGNLIHWLTDTTIDPFDDNRVWFNTGTGVFRCDNFMDKEPVFHDETVGIEETVHLNVYAPTGSDVLLIDILGDLGGFAFTDLDKPCDNSFADENGNRYITCINADYSDTKPERVVVTPRGNWTGLTKGGLIMTKDACRSFDRIDLPYGLSDNLDAHFRNIERPNVNSGWVALSSDGEAIVWCVADGIDLPMELVIVSKDQGKTWRKVTIDKKGAEDKILKVYSDRVDADTFYGFTENGNIYISKDKGESFARVENLNIKGANFGLIDCANKTEIRFESGKKGSAYIAAGKYGLYKLENMRLTKLSKEGDCIYRLGLGILDEKKDYATSDKAIYMCATIDGVYGFFRSLDQMKTIERLNTDAQMYGDINSLDADKRKFGRFFIATGSRGVLYGEQV